VKAESALRPCRLPTAGWAAAQRHRETETQSERRRDSQRECHSGRAAGGIRLSPRLWSDGGIAAEREKEHRQRQRQKKDKHRGSGMQSGTAVFSCALAAGCMWRASRLG
jgi:hypothetical protein